MFEFMILFQDRMATITVQYLGKKFLVTVWQGMIDVGLVMGLVLLGVLPAVLGKSRVGRIQTSSSPATVRRSGASTSS
jgi:hypothetical protein